MRRSMPFLLLLFIAVSAEGIPTQLTISRLAGGKIVIDGDVGDAAWERATRVDSFVEYWRGDNTAPPAKTIAWMTYDAAAVYFAFFAEDPRPAEIRAPFVDRDKVLGDQDYVAVLIDTQNDRRSGVAFRVNPRGIQTDSVVNDGSRTEDFSPDFFYEAVARQTPKGWSAEMRIPLSSLRYPSNDPQTWGVILMRNYPRGFRYIMANTPIPKSSNCFLCHASGLSGFEGLPSGGHLTLAPYTTAQRAERQSVQSSTMDLGMDMKWSPNAKLTIDATYNPDFSQIESDVPQFSVNNRFALDYPEKRTFFLEGVDLLLTGIRAVHTRTINAPGWGLRATGNSGSTAYTMLVAEDRGGGQTVIPGPYGSRMVPQDSPSLVFIGRTRTSFGRSYLGLMATAREVEGGGHNRVIGPDLFWKPTEKDRFIVQFLYSDTKDAPCGAADPGGACTQNAADGYAGRFVYTRDAAQYDIYLQHQDYADGFRADNGFVPQAGFRRSYGEVAAHIHPKKGFASFIRPWFAFDYATATDGGEIVRHGIFPGFFFRGKWGSEGWLTLHVAETERVGNKLLDYQFVEWEVKAAPWRSLPEVQVEGGWGEKIDYDAARVGKGGNVGIRTTVRPTDHLEVQAQVRRDWLRSVYTADLQRLKLTYTFSARSLARVIGQYSELDHGARTGDFTLSALYGYKLNWQTLFYIGYGDERLLDERQSLRPAARSVFMKIAYAFQR